MSCYIGRDLAKVLYVNNQVIHHKEKTWIGYSIPGELEKGSDDFEIGNRDIGQNING